MPSQRDKGIAWCDHTWNPTRGCSRVSQGCVNCYAEKQALRFAALPPLGVPETSGNRAGPFAGFVAKVNNHAAWTGKVELMEKKLWDPLHWRGPKRVFVNSMSDLFHEGLDFIQIDRVFAVMAMCSDITFQVLTKRAERLPQYVNDSARVRINRQIELWMEFRSDFPRGRSFSRYCEAWPLPNVHLGVSVEDQPNANKRIPELLATPAAKRFVSYEPALGPVDFRAWFSHLLPLSEIAGYLLNDGITDVRTEGLDWIIVGGESGPGARPFNTEWARSAISQCYDAEVKCFMKQFGASPFFLNPLESLGFDCEVMETRPDHPGFFLKMKDRKGGDMAEWPCWARIREFPG